MKTEVCDQGRSSGNWSRFASLASRTHTMVFRRCIGILLLLNICLADVLSPTVGPPRPSGNETMAVQLRSLAGSMRDLHRAKQNRDGGFSGGEAGGLLSMILQLQALIQALTPPAAETPADKPADPAKPPDPAKPDPAKPAEPAKPAAAKPAAGPTLQQLLALMALTNMRHSDDADQRTRELLDPDRKCASTGGVCDPHTVIHKILTFPDHILLLGDEEVFKAGHQGNVIDGTGEPKFVAYAQFGGAPQSTMRIGDLHYIFYENQVEVFLRNGSRLSGKVETSSVFFGIKTPVRGSFRFNDHTLTLFLAKYFLFYQPLVNPPVDPRFSPQPIDVIPGGPKTIDGAVEIDDRKYIYGDGIMYEIADDEMKVVSQKPLRKYAGKEGWLNCDTYCRN